MGIQAKGTSGIFIGPAYYYLVTVAYFFTNLDPIAAGFFAGASSVFAFFIFYFLTKKILSKEIALITIFINTFSFFVIGHDRIQWPISLIPPLSLIIFFSLYRVITGRVQYLLLLATAIGFSFNLHFTAVFYPLIVLLTLPFFPWNKKTIKYCFISLPLLLIWFLPNFIYNSSHQGESAKNLTNYLQIYYHGLHLRRMLQLLPDAFIEFEQLLIGTVNNLSFIKPIKYFLLPISFIVYFFQKPSKTRLIFNYLAALWFLIPWLVFSTYSGEITNYYFSSTRPIALIVLAYLTFQILQSKNFLFRLGMILFWLYFAFTNTQEFFNHQYRSFSTYRQYAINAVETSEPIEFERGLPDAYLYYYYKEVKNY